MLACLADRRRHNLPVPVPVCTVQPAPSSPVATSSLAAISSGPGVHKARPPHPGRGRGKVRQDTKPRTPFLPHARMPRLADGAGGGGGGGDGWALRVLAGAVQSACQRCRMEKENGTYR
jgi:hypothetical protein